MAPRTAWRCAATARSSWRLNSRRLPIPTSPIFGRCGWTPKGNLYAAGGTNAKVLRIDPAGKMTTAFESEELTAQALTLDKNDNLYVATSPDGKVYKVTPNGQKSVFFDPKAKYTPCILRAGNGWHALRGHRRCGQRSTQ